MIPILFEKTDTDFTTHGLCRLVDTKSDEVYTEGNGQGELTLEYPVIGQNYNEIQIERIIGTYADDTKNVQGYRIYAITRPLNGIVTVYARHVSYDLSGIAVTVPSGIYSPSTLMALIFQNTPFTGWSNIVNQKQLEFKTPISIRAILGGVEGSILDMFGGEYVFDNFTVKLYAQKGADNGVIVEYGKNITNLVDEYNTENVFTSILPYATYYDTNDEEQVVIGSKIVFNSILTTEKTAIIDFSDKFESEEIPTTAKLAELGAAYVEANNPGNTESSLSLSFIPLWYDGGSDVVGLYDVVTARHTKLGIDKKVKVVAIWYDGLAERISRMTCGKLSANFVSTLVEVAEQNTETAKKIDVLPNKMQQAIEYATLKITGNSGGIAVLHEGADGKPDEFLILDNPDITLAQNVWRWNLSGLGFSSNGYSGPYTTAITADGQINADMITTGALTVVDSVGNVLLEADPENRSVKIAGFSVQDDGMTFVATYASESGLGNATYELKLTLDGVVNSLTDYVTQDEEGNSITPYLYTSTSRVDEGIFEITDSFGNHAELVSDRLRFRHNGERLIALGPIYEKYNNSSTATAQTYTFSNIPSGVYLVFHCKQTTPTATSTGIQLLIIGSADPGAAIIRDIAGGSDIGASTTGSSYSTITATCNGDRTGNVVWKTKGASGYRKLILMRLN